MTNPLSSAHDSDTQKSWLAAHLRKLRSSELWHLELEPAAVASLVNCQQQVIPGQLTRNRDGHADSLPVEIHRLSGDRWEVRFSNGLPKAEVLGLIAANFPFAPFPPVEKEFRLPDLTRAIASRRRLNPEAMARIPSQLAAAGEEAVEPTEVASELPCSVKMDPYSLKYHITGSVPDLWAVVELECQSRDQETLLQRRIHQLKPNPKSELPEYIAKGQFDKTQLLWEAESDRVLQRLRSLDHHDLPFLTPDQKQQYLAQRSLEMQILPADEDTPQGVVCRVRETQRPGFCEEQPLQWYLHVAPRTPEDPRNPEDANRPGKKLLTDEESFWSKVTQREDAFLLGTAMILTGGDRDKAEDLVQEVFLKYLVRNPEARHMDDKHLHHSLHMAIQNLHIDNWRKKGNHQAQFAVDKDGISAESKLESREESGSAWDIGETMDRLLAWQEELFRQLPHSNETDEEKAVSLIQDIELVLLKLMGYSRPEIALILNISHGQYDNRFRRAKGSLGDNLPPGFWDDCA